MASPLPSNDTSCAENAHEGLNQSPRSRSGSPSMQHSEFQREQSYSPPLEGKSGENRLRPAADVINRIIWDESFSPDDYMIVFLDRFEGELEVSFDGWKKESTHEEFIPQHRVLYIKHVNGDVVWDRRRRIDTIFSSGNSAFSELAFLN
ncbi:hypothetical protein N7478_012215 [Penicillium angulare]|uniref:uncharacterized protein n=1 Tax=Penicillium angulare TaxID=116970 RepID=UPI002540F14F|nr:uncharacterized protein N7478_012215 [Penicillium angulare]KAJ5259234.1 hypothetical protein N7478_012215 [Penicillium angulare]